MIPRNFDKLVWIVLFAFVVGAVGGLRLPAPVQYQSFQPIGLQYPARQQQGLSSVKQKKLPGGIQTAQVAYKSLKNSFLTLGKIQPVLTFGQPGTYGGGQQSGSTVLDIVFVVDKSGSIGQSDFNIEKQFVKSAIKYFPVLPKHTRIAIVSYSSTYKLEFNFNKYGSRTCTRKGIDNILYTGGMTATGEALEYVRSSLIFNSYAGARYAARKYIFVLTDGKSNQGIKPEIPAKKLRASGVNIFVLGVTANINTSELNSIAGDSSKVVHIDSYAALTDVINYMDIDKSQISQYPQGSTSC